MDTERESTISILMLPWLAHGHVSPFFELAKNLSLKNFHTYICSTPINLEPIRENLNSHNNNHNKNYPLVQFIENLNSHNNNHNKNYPLVQFIDLQLPSSFQELPPHYHTTKNLPPHLMSTLKTAFDEAKSQFYTILKTLKPNLVIYDFLLPWAPEEANRLNIKSVLFLTLGGATCYFLTHWGTNSPPSMEFPFQEFNFQESERKKMTQFMHDRANGMSNEERFLKCIKRSSNMVLIKTSREIEDKYFDHLSILAQNKEIVTIGPLVQEPYTHKDNDYTYIKNWLSKKDLYSVVYVSFGSEYFLSREEIEEMAIGLELSKVNFIWVIRFHGGENVTMHEALPKGFLKIIGERVLVVEDWAPQAKILGHIAIGGFVSHGWSSTLEGIVFGVPIIAMPMHLDQPLNARLVEEIGVGLEMPRNGEKIDREEMVKGINEVMVKERGKEVRRRAKELSIKIREKGDEEMVLAVEKLVQLVKGI